MDLMTIRAILTLDTQQYEDGLKKSKSLAGKLGDGLKTGLGTAAKAAAVGIAAAGTAAVALGKQALSSYANFEQLVGGVETLFGAQGMSLEEYADSVGKTVDQVREKYASLTSAQNQVMGHASEAYKTAGLSANEYMETVTSFSASLIQSLGGDTEAAAKYADMAIVDMSDNANKMGTDMAAIQNAYQGFAKQNYTMLDNLKLGYGGTKQEMQRLIDDANKLRKEQGLSADLTIDSYADVVDAIHTVQTEMGITGTTAREAATTIEGSVKMTKSAWSNLVAGLADDNADFDTLLDNFIDSALTAADNILPRIQKIMSGIGKLLTQGAQKILPVVIETITSNLPQLVSTGIQLIITLITGIIQALPQLVEALPQIFASIKEAFAENWPAMREAGIQLLIMIAQGIAAGLQWVGQQMMALGSLIREKLSELATAAGEKVQEFREAIHNGIQTLLSMMGTWIEENIITPAREKITEFINIGSQIVENIKQGLTQKWESIKSFFKGKWSEIVGGEEGSKEVQAQVDALNQIFAAGSDTAGDAGAETVGEYVGSIKDGEGESESAGDAVSNATVAGMKSNADEAYRAGVKVIDEYNRGVRSKPAATPSSSGTGQAIGNDFIPYNNYPAILHRGEAVLTAREADQWRRGETASASGGTVINQYIEAVPQTPIEIASATAAMFEQARWAVA